MSLLIYINRSAFRRSWQLLLRFEFFTYRNVELLRSTVAVVNQSIKFIISVAHRRLDFTINSSIQI